MRIKVVAKDHKRRIRSFLLPIGLTIGLTLGFTIWVVTAPLSLHLDAALGSTGEQKSTEPFGVVGVLSAGGVANKLLRIAQRETWVKDSSKYNVQTLFLFDNPTPELLAEQDEYQDVVFLNATYSGRAVRFGEKLFNWFKIAQDRYPNAAFVGKIDDDCVVCTDQMWPFVWNNLSPTDYIGWQHNFVESYDHHKVLAWLRHDEYFVLVGSELVSRITSREYCHDLRGCDKNVSLFDTNYGGTSLGQWLSIYDDVEVRPINNKTANATVIKPNMKHAWPGTCPTYVTIHPVKSAKEIARVYNFSTQVD